MRIGFDLGGTKMLAAIVDDDGTVIQRNKNKTLGGGNEKVLEQIFTTITELLKKANIDASHIDCIGIAVPGPIDMESGVVLDTPNVGIKQLALARELTDRFGVAAYVENDVNAGLWGEFKAGSARGFEDVVGVFPGTGIGGGLILDGRLYRGKRGSAGEIGHMIVQTDGRLCGCGGYGCWETVASKTAIARDLVVLAMTGRSPTLVDKGGTEIRNIKSGVIAKAVEAGETGVIEVVDRAAYFLGVGLANVVNIFDPEIIVIGGGLVEKLGRRYLDLAEKAMRERAMPRIVEGVKLVEASLGDDAVIVGAADLAAGRMEK
jgi:glucokinase